MRKSISLVVLLLSLSLRAQTPYLVKDLNTTFSSDTKSSSPTEFAAFGNRIVFVAQTDETGQELWVTDGTPGGTSLAADIVPGNASSSPVGLIVVNGVLLFNARDANHGIELWTSDGTAAGTHIFMDLNPGPNSAQPGVRMPLKNGMLFLADDGINGREFWFTDGTVAGTRLVKDLVPGAASLSVFELFAFNNEVYFYTAAGELWKTDGTNTGTVKVMTLSGRNYLPAGNRIFFQQNAPGGGRDLFVSDGTEAGTHLVTEINPGPNGAFDGTNGFTAFGNGVLFVANDGTHGYELWFSDGTAAGTRMVADLTPGTKGTFDGRHPSITTVGNRAYFIAADDEHGTELWITDGTEGGTKLFADLTPGAGSSYLNSLRAVDGKLYFTAYVGSPAVIRVFVTDGGTPRVLGNELWPTVSAATFWPIAGKLYFPGADGLTGTEPWVTDGTSAGTHMIANIAADNAPSSSPRNLLAIGDTLLFTAAADDPARYLETALWRSDGTSSGTYRLLPGAEDIRPLGSFAFFNTRNSTATTMMRTDGTIAGTAQNSDFKDRFGTSRVDQLYPIGDTLYVSATSTKIPFGDYTSLWKTTAAPGASATELGSISPRKPISVGGRIYFYASESFANAYERGLWTSDGTPGGTYGVIPELNADGYGIGDIVNVAGTLYYLAQRRDEKTKLWKSDGTFDGTVAVKELTFTGAQRVSIAAAGHRVFFVAEKTLWTSDGTEAGTVSLMSVKVGPGFDVTLFTVGDRVVFDSYDYSEYDSAIHELWSSDGTVAGTKLLLKQVQNPSLTCIDGILYFAGFDEAHGVELWSSDGTTEGTKLLADVNPGPHSSRPAEFTKAGNDIYFSAYNDSTGYELWALPLGAGTLSIDDARVVEGDSGTATMRFRVSLSAPSAQAVSVEYATADGAAQAGQDYDAASGTLTFAPGETVKTIDVLVRGDAAIESNETLFVRLRNSSARIVKSEGAGIIDDDDQRADVSIEPQFTASSTSVSMSLRIANNGPRAATNVTVEFIAPDEQAGACYNCDVPQLASGASKTLSLYFSYSVSTQTVFSATVTAHETDPQPANNSVAWLVGMNNYMVMNAPYLTTGSTAVIYGSSFAFGAVPTSSDPSVVAVSTNLTKLNDYVSSFTVTGVKPGTSTITYGQFSLIVTVVAPGGTPRWPGAMQFTPGFTATNFDKPLTITVTPIGKAPFTGVTPTGTVRVTSGNKELARRTFVSTASFSFPVYLPALGTNSYTISYDGDAVFLPQSTTASTFVRKGSATLLGNLEPVNTPSTYRLSVSVAGSPASPPSGTVSVLNGSAEIARLTLVPGADGTSTAQTMLPGPGGPPTLTLNYSGDAFYDAGTQQVRNVVPRRHATGH